MLVGVTGSAGFLGQHVVRELEEAGHDVLEWDIGGLYPGENFIDSFCNATPDIVVCLGAYSIVSESISKAPAYYANNLGHILECVEYCDFERVPIIFASSAASNEPSNPYGWSKHMSEQIVRDCCDSWSILRLYNLVGPGERHIKETHLLPNLLDSAILGTVCPIYNGGMDVRDYIDVRDVARFIRIQVEKHRDISDLKEHWHVGSGTGMSTQDIINCCLSSHIPVRVDMVEGRDKEPSVLVSPTAIPQEYSIYETIRQTHADRLDWRKVCE